MSVPSVVSPWLGVWNAWWRSLGYCLLMRVQLLGLAPLLFSAVLLGGLAWWGWTPANEAVRAALDQWGWSQTALGWLDRVGLTALRAALVPMLISIVSIPVIVLVCLVAVGAIAAPAMASLVRTRRFPALKALGQMPWWQSLAASLKLTAMALVVLLLSLPLWFVPPVAGLVAPLVWGWLAYRVMTLDVLADWATADEMAVLVKEHRAPLLAMGVVSGYMGSGPALLWAAGGVMTFAFAPVLVVVSVWVYTLVFVITALWFAHYLLEALHRLRTQRPVAKDKTWLV